jgi:hypothetical protein
MKTRNRKAFTLVELLVSTLIFAFMVMSMTTIYTTANNHLFQTGRQNVVKSNSSVAVKAISQMLSMANRIDAPAAGASGNILAFAINVDQLSGCYPINRVESASWFYICYAPAVTPECPLGRCLFAHVGLIPGGQGCPAPGPVTSAGIWQPLWPLNETPPRSPAYPPVACGVGSGEMVTMLSSFVEASAGSPIFARRSAPGESADLVDVSLRVLWDPENQPTAGHTFRTASNKLAAVRKIDHTLKTTIRVNRCALLR